MIRLANASTGNAEEESQVLIMDWYERGWDYIVRPHSNIVNGLTFFAEKACNNKFVLYSQEKRLTFDRTLQCYNYDINQLTSKVYCDCSSFVGTCLNAVGEKVDLTQFTTRNMVDVLEDKGYEIIAFNNKSQLIKGDILVRVGSHTVLVVDVIEDIEKSGTVKLSDVNSYLNIREKPNSNSKVVGTLKHGEQVTIKSELTNWYKIEQGYVSRKYIV